MNFILPQSSGIIPTSFFCELFQIMKSEVLRVTHELQAMKDKIKENSEKIKVNKTLPYLVSNVIEVRAMCVRSDEGSVHTSPEGGKCGEAVGQLRRGVSKLRLLLGPGLSGFSAGFVCDLAVLLARPPLVPVVP